MTLAIFGSQTVAAYSIAASNAVIIRQGSGRTLLEQLADVSQILIALAVLALIGLLYLIMNELRERQKKVFEMVDGLRTDLAPTITNVNEVTANLSYVADIIARRVSAVDETVDLANVRIRDTVDVIYGRVRKIDAVLQVAQEELEDVVISSASVIRGVKRGAAAATRRRGNHRRRREVEQARGTDVWDDDPELADDDLFPEPGARNPKSAGADRPTIAPRPRDGRP